MIITDTRSIAVLTVKIEEPVADLQTKLNDLFEITFDGADISLV